MQPLGSALASCLIFLSIVFAALPVSARADAVAWSCEVSAQSKVTITREYGACTGFDATDEHGVRGHVDFGSRISGQVFVSADGHRLVAVQSRFLGFVDDNGNISNCGIGQTGPKCEPLAVLIYRDRQLVASYRFPEIMLRPRLFSHSVSHVEWLRNLGGFDESDGKKLFLDTTSFRHVEFDLESGRIEKQQDSPEWNDCDVIAYGDIKRLGSRGEIGPTSIIKGDATRGVKFEIPSQLNIESNETICLKNTPSGLTAISTLPLMFNEWKR
jgi:hypothetical protein